MAITHGMNIQAVQKLSTDLKTEAGNVNDICTRIAKMVDGMTEDWKGSDAERFASDWNGTYKVRLLDLVKALEELSTKAATNAQEQTDASGK